MPPTTRMTAEEVQAEKDARHAMENPHVAEPRIMSASESQIWLDRNAMRFKTGNLKR